MGQSGQFEDHFKSEVIIKNRQVSDSDRQAPDVYGETKNCARVVLSLSDVSQGCILLVPRLTEPPARRVELELRLDIRKQFYCNN